MKNYKKVMMYFLVILMTISISINSTASISDPKSVVKFSAGENFSIAMLQDGSVSIWGNLFDTKLANAPVNIEGIDNIKDLKAGKSHCAFLKNDGSVWVIGQTSWIDGFKEENILIPRKIDGLNDIEKIDSGNNYILALKSDGTAYSIGLNSNGQLGNGSFDEQNKPAKILELKNIKDLSAGENHSLAIDENGNVWSWGSNEFGQLSRGVFKGNYKTPGISAGLKKIKAIDASNNFSIFLKEDGTLLSCGLNDLGQLGIGNNDNKNLAEKVAGLAKIIRISSGYGHSIAIMNDTSIWTWGYNNRGQLGIGNTINSNQPQKIELKSGIDVSCNGFNSLILKTDLRLWAIGDNTFAQLGNGEIVSRNTPVDIGLSNISSIGTGMMHSFAINDGKLYGWGLNSAKQVGNFADEFITTPQIINEINNVSQIDGGMNHTIALKQDKTVWTWGSNEYKQLGSVKDSAIPVLVSGLQNIKKITAGFYHNLALDESGNVYAWGRNSAKQLGFYSDEDIAQPVLVDTLHNIIDVKAGDKFSIALDQNGDVWTFGDNEYGQLGYEMSDIIPQKVTGLSNIVAIFAGDANAYAIDQEGNLWLWGKNEYGELGNETLNKISSPTKVTSINNVKEVSCGERFSAYLLNNGEIKIFGTLDEFNFDTNVKSISCGADFICINQSNGKVNTIGNNNNGQLGSGNSIYSKNANLTEIYKKENLGILVAVNGEVLDFDVDPLIVNSRTMVPLRGIFEKLNVEVTWDPDNRSVTCTKGDKKVIIKIDNNIALVDDKEVTLEVAPTIRDSRTLVPLRFVSESLGAYVDWDQETKTAIVAEK